jgi:multidrug efflux pump subunit AcrB
LVGQKTEDAIVQLYNKLYANLDKIPPGVSQPLIKSRAIDDVPIIALTLWSDRGSCAPNSIRWSGHRLIEPIEYFF